MAEFENAFAQYTHVLALPRYNVLDAKEERELIVRYHQTKESKVFDRLVSSHLRFVVYLLRSYKLPAGIDIMDIIQEGNEGLIMGIQRYDPSHYTCRVFTYCSYWIRVRIGRFLEERSDYSKREAVASSDEELEELKNVQYDTPVDRDHAADRRMTAAFIGEASQILTEREVKIVTLHKGLEPPDYRERTLQEIGSKMHLNLERVRQIYSAAVNKLKTDDIKKLLST